MIYTLLVIGITFFFRRLYMGFVCKTHLQSEISILTQKVADDKYENITEEP